MQTNEQAISNRISMEVSHVPHNGQHIDSLQAVLNGLLEQTKRLNSAPSSDIVGRASSGPLGGGRLKGILHTLLEQNNRLGTSSSSTGVAKRHTTVNGRARVAKGSVKRTPVASDRAHAGNRTAATGDSAARNTTTSSLEQSQMARNILAMYANSTPPGDLVPQTWDFVEAAEYWNVAILASRCEGELANRKWRQINQAVYRPSPAARLGLITSAVAYHIKSISREMGIPIRLDDPGENAHLWAVYHRYAGELIRSLNHDISLAATRKVPSLFKKILVLTLLAEIHVQPTSWRPHLEGFFTLLHLRGGIKEVTRSGEADNQTLYLMTLHAIMADTTSPSLDPTNGVSYLTTAEIRTLHDSRYYPEFPCPTYLFLEIRSISQLRNQFASGACRDQVQASADDIFARITAFSRHNWNDKWELSDDVEMFAQLGRVYQAAISLYGILSLPRFASICLLNSDAATYKTLKHSRRVRCLEMICTAWEMLASSKSSLYWPLIVVGVAFADGDSASQTVIRTYLHSIAMYPSSSACPLYVEEKLKAFWASGKTNWDDCFDEPVLGLTE